MTASCFCLADDSVYEAKALASPLWLTNHLQKRTLPQTEWPSGKGANGKYWPQAFSHFSYSESHRRRLVCDLQGVYDERENILKFSDPVIHYFNQHREDRRGVHGRTDRGKKGMAQFFDTHKEQCGHLCRLVTGGFRKGKRRQQPP